MTINKYFDNQVVVDSEQNLAEDLIIEQIQQAGRDLFYIPRNTGNIDEILGETPLLGFGQFSVIEAYLANYNDMAGNNILLSNFGISTENTAEFIISRKRFAEVVQPKPFEGDLLYDSLSKLLFQIGYVDEEPAPSYQLQKLYTYTLKCTLFTYSYETFNTGIAAVDADLNPSTFVDVFDKSKPIALEAEADIDQSEENPFGTIFSPSQDSND